MDKLRLAWSRGSERKELEDSLRFAISQIILAIRSTSSVTSLSVPSLRLLLPDLTPFVTSDGLS